MHQKFVKQTAASGNPIDPEMNPAEETPIPVPGEEHICPVCGGGGLADDGTRCEACGGTGKAPETGASV